MPKSRPVRRLKDWPENKSRQKDVDARWTQKSDENHYGYKNHINADANNKLIQDYGVTDAAVHDSQVFDERLDHTLKDGGLARPIYADSAYRSLKREAELNEAGIRSEICEKGSGGHPLTEAQEESNRLKSKVRARVEHVCASANGRPPGAYHRPSTGEGKDRDDESGVQHEAVGAVAQARWPGEVRHRKRERCAVNGLSGAKSQKNDQNRTN
jgi:IS5 family transposase